MQDIFNDAVFETFLRDSGGSVQDLDEDIGQLIYEIWKNKVADTYWSCSGHIGRRVETAISSRPDTHHVYHCGFILFGTNNSPKHNSFLDAVRTQVSKTPFARLDYRKEEDKDKYNLHLEMDDLSDNFNSPEAAKRLGFMYQPSNEIEIPKAVMRYAEFKRFWKNLEEQVRKI